jgi:hypothetical protein
MWKVSDFIGSLSLTETNFCHLLTSWAVSLVPPLVRRQGRWTPVTWLVGTLSPREMRGWSGWWGRYVGTERSSAVVKRGLSPREKLWHGVWCSKLLACSHRLRTSIRSAPLLAFPTYPLPIHHLLFTQCFVSCLIHIIHSINIAPSFLRRYDYNFSSLLLPRDKFHLADGYQWTH